MLSFVLACAAFAPQAPRPDARELWSAGERAEAIEARRAELAGTTGEAWRELVAWQLSVHRAKQALEDALRCGPACDTLRAEAHYALDEYAAAVPLLDESDPVQALWKIDALEALSRFDESDAALARARERFGASDSRFHGCDGRRLARLGRHAEAATAFRAALAVDPLDGEAHFGLGRALVASGAREEGLKVLGEHRRLVPLLDELDFARRSVDLAPNHAPNHTAVGDAERALGRRDAARAAYARAEALGRGAELVPNALRLARLCADDENDLEGALAALARAHTRFPDARLCVRRGDLLLAARRDAEAIAAYEDAAKLRPGDAEIAKRLESARARSK